MLNFIKIILPLIFGIFINSMIFSLVIFMYYKIYGSNNTGSSLFLGSFLSGIVTNPVLVAFILSLVSGAIHGFLISLFIVIFNPSTGYKGVLISVLVTLLFAFIFSLPEAAPNIENIDNMFLGSIISDLLATLYTSLFYILPAIVTGISVTKLISYLENRF